MSALSFAAVAACGVLTLALVACQPGADHGASAAAAGEGEEVVRRATLPIVNGVIDTENPATIAFGQGSFPFASCSGTIVKVDGVHGWALTAAHCADNIQGSVVMMGHLDENPRQFPVVSVVANPAYDPDVHTFWNDYAMVRFMGADATLPVVPIATPAEDSLSLGLPITLAGYGQMEGGGSSTKRRSIDRTIQNLGLDTFTYDQTDGGICFGDSGGPAYADLPVGRRVVGVTTVVSGEGCLGWGGSARVSSHYTSFIEPLLSRPTFDSCWSCFGPALGTAECNALFSACFSGTTTCSQYNNCLNTCGADQTCRDACAVSWPEGAAQYAEAMSCPCGSCGELCQDELICGGDGGGCGFVSNEPTCSSCIDGCCAEASACSDDPQGCGGCFPHCDANPTAGALQACLEAAPSGPSSCFESCGLHLFPPTPDGEGGAGGGDTGGGHSEGGSTSNGHGGAATPEGGAPATGGASATAGAPAEGGESADDDGAPAANDTDDDGCTVTAVDGNALRGNGRGRNGPGGTFGLAAIALLLAAVGARRRSVAAR